MTETTFRVATSPLGSKFWWPDGDIIPADHSNIRAATAQEADLITRILKHAAAGRRPPKGLGDRLKALWGESND